MYITGECRGLHTMRNPTENDVTVFCLEDLERRRSPCSYSKLGSSSFRINVLTALQSTESATELVGRRDSAVPSPGIPAMRCNSRHW